MQVGDAYMQPLKGWLLISMLWSGAFAHSSMPMPISACAVASRYIEHMFCIPDAKFAEHVLP